MPSGTWDVVGNEASTPSEGRGVRRRYIGRGEKLSKRVFIAGEQQPSLLTLRQRMVKGRWGLVALGKWPRADRLARCRFQGLLRSRGHVAGRHSACQRTASGTKSHGESITLRAFQSRHEPRLTETRRWRLVEPNTRHIASRFSHGHLLVSAHG